MIKKNITINFCGRLYNIDEDAYELLSHYTESIRRYYSNIEGGEEIADDIEERIAELFDEEKAKGKNAIDAQMTENIIKRIGVIDDIKSEDEEPRAKQDTQSQGSTSEKLREGAEELLNDMADRTKNAWNTLKSDKRFFRDKQNAILAGVLAGCAQFFGGGVLMWRLVFLALVLIPIPILDYFGIGGILVFIYIVLAIIAPQAETPEQVLSMQGKDVNPHNIAEEVSRQTSKDSRNVFGEIVSVFLKIILIVVGTIMLSVLIGILCAVAVFFTEPLTWFTTWFHWHTTPEVFEVAKYPFYVCSGAVIAILVLLLYCTIHAILSAFKKISPMGILQRIICLVLFIVCFVVAVAAGFKTITTGERMDARFRFEIEQTEPKFTYGEDEEYFSENGWKLTKARNCSGNRLTTIGEYYDGNTNYRYLDAYNANGRKITYHAEKTEDCEEGTYSLSSVCRASEGAKGVFAFAIVEKDGKEIHKHLFAFPAYGNKGTQIFTDAIYRLPGVENEENYNDIKKANDGKGFGWTYIKITDIDVPDGATVRYGVSTDKEFTGEKCTAKWFSACDFNFTKQD